MVNLNIGRVVEQSAICGGDQGRQRSRLTMLERPMFQSFLVTSVQGMKGGVYGINSVEWMLAMQAYNSQSVFCVPLYDTLGEFTATEGCLQTQHVSVQLMFSELLYLVAGLSLTRAMAYRLLTVVQTECAALQRKGLRIMSALSIPVELCSMTPPLSFLSELCDVTCKDQHCQALNKT